MPCSKLHCQKALNSIHLSHKITNLILQVAGEGRGGDPGAAARQLHALDRHQHQAAGEKRALFKYFPRPGLQESFPEFWHGLRKKRNLTCQLYDL